VNFLENTDTFWGANFHFNGASLSFLVFGQNPFKGKAPFFKPVSNLP
jgi:hypothetical protein